MYAKILSYTIFILLSSLCWSLPTDKDQPINLTANSADMDEGKEISVYKGNVVVLQGSMRLMANEVTVFHPNRKAQKIIATGAVKFSQKKLNGEMIRAKANKANFFVTSELLELTGDASLTQSGDTMKSDRITYDRVKHKVKAGNVAKGKERVKITIQPKD
tara:strand:- start:3433 stop:3915 length:483 start_codon:yes stop_codon:yes gene_type:complete